MADDVVVEVTARAVDAELAADRLWQAGATAVGWSDGDGTVSLTASFPTPEAARTVAAEVGGTARVVDGGWRDEWRRWAQPVQVGRVVVVPVGRLVVRIDAGAAFGSGSHPSTRLALAELDRDPPAACDVLDVGSGSGILSVVAALLGAASVTAVDIDPEARRATATNAEANGVGAKVRVWPAPLEDLDGTWDVALVNVTAGVHAELGGHVAPLVRPGGRLVLAGLLPGQWRHVSGAYPGTTVVDRPLLDGWEGVVLRR